MEENEKMKAGDILGLQLVAKERLSQLLHHKISIEIDKAFNNHYQLSEAAGLLTSLDMDDLQVGPEDCCPIGWDLERWRKMWEKPYFERMIIAAALLCAEIDRMAEIGDLEVDSEDLKAEINWRNDNATKARKWDALGERIAKCYEEPTAFAAEDDTEDEDEFGDLTVIGEIAASAFGYMG